MNFLRFLTTIFVSIVIMCIGGISTQNSDSIIGVVYASNDWVYTRESSVIDETRVMSNYALRVYLSGGGYSLVTLRSGQYGVIESSKLKFKSTEPIVSYTQGVPDEVTALELKAAISFVPSSVQSQFNEAGWVFDITTENLTEKYIKKHSLGLETTGATVFKEKKIELLQEEERVYYTANHELGHYIDKELAPEGTSFLSDSPAFQQIYEEEASNTDYFLASKGYVTKDAREFFAESINQCFLFPDIISKQAPKTYAFCLACIASVR